MKGFIFCLSLMAAAVVIAQPYPRQDGLNYEELARRSNQKSLEDFERYRSSLSLPDSVERFEQRPAPSNIPADSLTLFGYNLFARGGSANEIPQNLAVPVDYKLGPGDNIIVNLWGRVEQEFNLTVDRQGAVFIPKIGEVPIWGLTIQQAEQRLKDRLTAGFSEFQLSVTLGKLKSIQVFVFGEVKYPGSYSVNSLSTMFSALYLAGGPSERGSLRSIRLIRSGIETARVDLYDFLLFGRNVAGVALQSGDVVFVDVVGQRVTVTGAVKREAIFEIRGDETIGDVVALGGGTLPTAYLEKVRVDRITRTDAYQVIDLNLKDSSLVDRQFRMADGDVVTVESIYDHKLNVIHLEGRFRHPGIYQYREGMTLADLFAEGCELEDRAYRGRIDILRREHNYDTTLITVDPEAVLAGRGNILLQAHDRLIAYAQDEVLAPQAVSIYGLVARPGDYAFYQGMKVSDLVFRAGNLQRSAYPLRIELARTFDDGRREVLYASLDDPQQDLTLETNDKVFVRQIPGWEERDIVTIEGEVEFPGKYVITPETNSLYSLVQRAGGLSAEAFAAGTVFTRATIINDLKRRGVDELINRSIEVIEEDSGQIVIDSSGQLRDNSMSNRIVVNAGELLERGNTNFDIRLRDGDHIYIPAKPAGIQVLGAVPSVSTIAFRSDKKVDYYIRSAGGFLPNADRKNLLLVRANGTIASGGGVRGKEVMLGDAIFVPTKVAKDRDWLRFFSTTASIAASIATTIFVIDRL